MKTDDLVKVDFLNALLAGDRQVASKIIQNLLQHGVQINYLYEEIIKDAMYKVGDLWENGSISVATEHLASAVVQAILNDLYSYILTQTKNSKIVVIGCVENEQHQIGAKMVADVFDMNEWNTHFLGAGLPVEDLIRFMKDVRPDVLALSVSLHLNLSNLGKMIEAIHQAMPGLLILIGGQAFNKGGQERFLKYPDILYANGLYELESLLANRA